MDIKQFQNYSSSKQKSIVVFSAPSWCAPCRSLSKNIEASRNKNPNLSIFEIDIDVYPDLASEVGVMSVPTVFYFGSGESNRKTGVQSVEQLLGHFSD
jgi:thioredoxin-like negative regulator of GroEL